MRIREDATVGKADTWASTLHSQAGGDLGGEAPLLRAGSPDLKVWELLGEEPDTR